MEPAASKGTNRPLVHRPNEPAEGQEIINIKQVTRSHSARVEAVGKKSTSTALTSRHNSYRYLDGHQMINSNNSIIKPPLNKSQVWDCESSLYDSFELNSLNLQLDLAIKDSSTRTLSTHHLPEPYPPNIILSTSTDQARLAPKKSSRVSKSLNKILRSVFGSSKPSTVTKRDTNYSPSPITNNVMMVPASTERRNGGSLYVYDGSKSMRVLTTIPESQEIDDGRHSKLSPDTPAVRRAVSERFSTAPSVRVNSLP